MGDQSIQLYVRCYQHIIAYLDDIVIQEGAVHIDHHLVADEYMLSTFTMKVRIDT